MESPRGREEARAEGRGRIVGYTRGVVCPTCKYSLAGHRLVDGVVRCPECGRDHEPANRPPPFEVHWATALALLIVIVVFVVGLIVPAIGCSCRITPTFRARMQLQQIGQSLLLYGSENDDALPHAALLLTREYVSADTLLDNGYDARQRSIVGGVDLAVFDWTDAEVARLERFAEEPPVAAAYRFGDFMFAAWPPDAPLATPGILAWSRPQPEGERLVFMADGTMDRVAAKQWPAVWEKHVKYVAPYHGRPCVPEPPPGSSSRSSSAASH